MRHVIFAAAAAISLGAMGATSDAAAATFTFGFDQEHWAGDQTAGSYQSLRISYDDGAGAGAARLAATPTLDFAGSVQMTDAGLLTGGWFALTPGGDPRQADDEIAIFYMDFATGRLSAYRYDGNISEGFYSYQNPDLFIGSWADAVSTTISDEGLLDFAINDLDVSAVQTASAAAGYTGVSFGHELGIWLHLSVMRDAIAFDADGRLTNFRPGDLASLDRPRVPTDAVPLPGAALFLVTGAAGLAAVRRRRR